MKNNSETFIHPKATSDAHTFVEFDWDSLFELFDGVREDKPDREKLCLALREVFRFIVRGGIGMRGIALRAVALSWVVNPDLWDGKSATQVAHLLGVNPDVLHRHTGAARRRFGIKNHSQDHAGNFKK
jgi:hypothetical protein